LKGYETALRDYGTFDWADLIQPAIHYARAGFQVREHMHWYWAKDQSGDGFANTRDKLAFSKSGRQIYFDAKGELLQVGDILRNPEMGTTLERIARSGGSDIFYKGELAQEIAADFKKHGGLISE